MSDVTEAHFQAAQWNRSETRKRVRAQNQKLKCFCYGFIWSTLLATTAFVLSQIIFYQNDVIHESSCQKRIIGSYRIWEPKDVRYGQLSKLTHILFASVFYQLHGGIGFMNNNEKRNFEMANKKAKPFKVKTMFTLEIGDYATKDIPGLMADKDKRKVLVNSIINFIREYQMDGINLYWEFPKTEIVKWFVTTLCKEIREELTKVSKEENRKELYIMSLVCSREKTRLDVDEILKYVDFLNIETDNYYASWIDSSWNRLTGPPTPLYGGHVENSKDNLDATMKYYSCLTQKSNQLNIMVTFGGRLWRNIRPPSDPSKHLWMVANSENGKVDGGPISWRILNKNVSLLE